MGKNGLSLSTRSSVNTVWREMGKDFGEKWVKIQQCGEKWVKALLCYPADQVSIQCDEKWVRQQQN